jgi:hypothetical protein
MGVINNELPKIVNLNGRIALEDGGSRSYECRLLPGLNTVDDDLLEDLQTNERFQEMLDYRQATVVKQATDTGAGSVTQESPEAIDDIVITAMNVRDAREVIASCATMEQLDAWEREEKEDGSPRKGVMQALEEQRKVLNDLNNPEGEGS